MIFTLMNFVSKRIFRKTFRGFTQACRLDCRSKTSGCLQAQRDRHRLKLCFIPEDLEILAAATATHAKKRNRPYSNPFFSSFPFCCFGSFVLPVVFGLGSVGMPGPWVHSSCWVVLSHFPRSGPIEDQSGQTIPEAIGAPKRMGCVSGIPCSLVDSVP